MSSPPACTGRAWQPCPAVLPSAAHPSPTCLAARLPACLQVRTTVKRLDGAPLDKFPLYYDEVHPWGPTGHRCV